MNNTTIVHQVSSGPPLTNDTIEACLPLVKAITGRIRASHGPVASFDDLYAVGIDGLFQAAERFDPARGVAFTSFAYHRIRGAILDSFRRGPQGRRPAAALAFSVAIPLEPAALQPANDNGRLEEPTRRASRPRWSDTVMAHLVPFEEIDAMPDDTVRPADEEVDRRALTSRVEAALAALPEMDRRIIELHYYEELTFAQIGEKLGMCKPWAFRLHQRAIGRLREALRVVTDADEATLLAE